ncbi:MAG: SGNH/GDSL hydrolase family protein [Chitinophagaceae bacterium]|jgi:lysophospholipase L1-like esterase|nr:SGNH/GDSL hydrolase family protein [Chitinophagaceae bacterium]
MYSYLALGDSYTIGEQVAFPLNFPNQMVQLLRQQNIAIADPVIVATTGFTTDELQAAIRENNINEQFSIVSLLIGVNNQYRGRSLANYEEEFTQLLQQAIHFANDNGEKVFVLSIPDWGATPFAEGKDRMQIATEIDAYNAAAKKISQAHQCHFIDITDSTRANGNKQIFLAEDKLHPSAKEYAVWALRLADSIVATL